MEEIDSIIMDSLQNLHCDFEENITSLRQFDADMIVTAISICLEAILPDTSFPKKLPPSMSLRLKIATDLAEQIKDLGFRDDMGYQTILYCNEAEIRRVFMFLIERLPRETSKALHVEQTGYVPTLVKEIKKKMKNSLQQPWVPSYVLSRGCRPTDAGLVVNSFGETRPLHSKRLKVPHMETDAYEALKHYWIHNVPVVTQQCTTEDFLSCLLFDDGRVTFGDFELKTQNKREIDEELPSQLVNVTVITDHKEVPPGEVKPVPETKLQILLQELGEKRSSYLELQQVVKASQLQLSQIEKLRLKEEEALQNILTQVTLKAKTLTVLSKEDNFEKLKDMIEASNNKLISLTEQWEKIHSPLLEEYKLLQNLISSEDLKMQEEQRKLLRLEENYKSLSADLKEKTLLEEQLRKKLVQLNKTHNRAGYTRRILEIIGNIKKQDEEIQKILQDTTLVQKEISSLTGQIDRSFTISDELIFRDAKHDESARKAYKLLAQLRDECSEIIKGVTTLGAVERECRNLQDQIDSETARGSSKKIDQVSEDLLKIKKETEMLLKQGA